MREIGFSFIIKERGKLGYDWLLVAYITFEYFKSFIGNHYITFRFEFPTLIT